MNEDAEITAVAESGKITPVLGIKVPLDSVKATVINVVVGVNVTTWLSDTENNMPK